MAVGCDNRRRSKAGLGPASRAWLMKQCSAVRGAFGPGLTCSVFVAEARAVTELSSNSDVLLQAAESQVELWKS